MLCARLTSVITTKILNLHGQVRDDNRIFVTNSWYFCKCHSYSFTVYLSLITSTAKYMM